jgi:hypothetical protein
MFAKLIVAENCSDERCFVRFGARVLGYKDFVDSDSGVVTIEWVALAAGLVVGTLVVSFIIMNGLVGVASNVASQLSP